MSRLRDRVVQAAGTRGGLYKLDRATEITRAAAQGAPPPGGSRRTAAALKAYLNPANWRPGVNRHSVCPFAILACCWYSGRPGYRRGS